MRIKFCAVFKLSNYCFQQLVNIFDICSTIFVIKKKNEKHFCVFFTRKTGFPFDETPNVGQSRAQLSI